MTWLMAALHVNSGTELAWVVFGLCAQLMFTARFVIQWIASERARSSVMPVALARHDQILRRAIDAHGGWVFATGVMAQDFKNGIAPDVLSERAPHAGLPKREKEALRIWENIDAVLRAAGTDRTNLVRTDQYYTTVKAVPPYQQVRRQFLDGAGVHQLIDIQLQAQRAKSLRGLIDGIIQLIDLVGRIAGMQHHAHQVISGTVAATASAAANRPTTGAKAKIMITSFNATCDSVK